MVHENNIPNLPFYKERLKPVEVEKMVTVRKLESYGNIKSD